MNIKYKHHRSILLTVGLITAILISDLFFGKPLSCKTDNEKVRKSETQIGVSQSILHLAHQKGQRALSLILRSKSF